MIEHSEKWEVNEQIVQFLLEKTILKNANPNNFPEPFTLDKILSTNCRIRKFRRGEIIMEKGQLTTSVYFIKTGDFVNIIDDSKSNLLDTLGEEEDLSEFSLMDNPLVLQAMEAISSINNAQEVRFEIADERKSFKTLRTENKKLPFLDILLKDKGVTKKPIRPGQILGEVAAITRSVRATTVVALSPGEVIEMRWQGLRQIILRDLVIYDNIMQSYKKLMIQSRLSNMDLFRDIPDDLMRVLIEQANFFRIGQNDDDKRTEHVIVEQGEVYEGVYLIVSGSGRVYKPLEVGTMTINYLIPDDVLGLLDFIRISNDEANEPKFYTVSFSFFGMGDCIFLPYSILKIVKKYIMRNFAKYNYADRILSKYSAEVNYFFIEENLIAGTEVMVINSSKCTGCDDCVRACANAHEGNPKFSRSGAQFKKFVFANACLHCLDPQCLTSCPTSAIKRPISTSYQTEINEDACIGCGNCEQACPFDAVRMIDVLNENEEVIINQETGNPVRKAVKCDLCIGRIGGPACVSACPTGAMRRVNFNDRNALVDWI